MAKSSTRVWEITGWDSTQQIFTTTVPCGQITEVQLQALLRVLAAKFGLTPGEIVGCHLKRGTKGYRAHLELSRENSDERRSSFYSCGDNPYVMARIREAK